MPISRLIEYVPEKVVRIREPLSDEKNAWFLWREAVDAVRLPEFDEENPNDLLGRLRYGDPETGEDVDIENDEERDYVAGLVKQNQRVFDLVDEGIRRGDFRFPDPQFEDTIDDNKNAIEAMDVVMEMMGRVYDAMCYRIKLDRANQDFSSMLDHLMAMLRMGKIICASNSMVVHFIVASSFQGSALRGMKRLVSEGHLPKNDLRNLLDIIEQQKATEEDLAGILGVELGYYEMSHVERLPETSDQEALVDKFIDVYYYEAPLTIVGDDQWQKENPEAHADQLERLEWRREKIHYLLDDHPCLFDKVATARLMGEQVMAAIKKVRQSGNRDENRDPQVEKSEPWISQVWPEQLHPEFPPDLLSDSPFVQQKRSEYKEFMSECDSDCTYEWSLPPTKAELDNAREQLREIENPIGQLLASYLIDESVGLSSLDMLRKEYEETLQAFQVQLEQP